MKTRIPVLVLALAAILPVSCNKDNETEETKLYLNGNMSIEGEYYYVELGNTIDFRVYNVSHPLASSSSTGHRLGLYYKITGLMEDYDTLYNATVNPLKDPVDVSFSLHQFESTDSLGTFSLSVYVYPEDSDKYYSSSRTISITTVDLERSVPELAFDPMLPYVTDFRGPLELSYNYTCYDEEGKELPNAWLTRNMSYLGSGKGYYGVDDMSYLFGRYYTYEEALDACPEGWRLPSDNDWAELANAVAGTWEYMPYTDFKGAARHFKYAATFNGSELWEFWPDAPVLGTSGLNMIPIGFCNAALERDFNGFPDYACFWTADENPFEPGQAYYRYLVSGDDDFKLGSADVKSMAMSVRCVAE